MPSTPSSHHFVEEGANAVGIGAVEKSGIGGDAEAALDGFADAFDGLIVTAFAADGKIVMIALTVTWTEKVRYLLGLKRSSFP